MFVFLTILIILILFCLYICFSKFKNNFFYRKQILNSIDPKKYKHYFENEKVFKNEKVFQKDKIFVSIASYRDDQCMSTVQNLTEMADKPENLHILICQQNNEKDDTDCLAWCVSDNNHPACKANITHIERLSHEEARGPCWARWRIQQMWTGEEYYFQIDSHTRVIKGWDTILKKQLSLCPSSKPCLTQYPPEYHIVSKENRKNKDKEKWNNRLRGPLYIEKFGEEGFTRIQSNWWKGDPPNTPFESIGWAGGFSFSKAEFIEEVPYDQYTPFLFFGEEMDIAIRAYTNGWDFYSPTVNCVFSNYKRNHRKTFWENKDSKSCEILSRFRVYERLGYIKDIPEKYKFILNNQLPLGKERSISDYEQKAKICIKKEKLI